MPPPTHTTRLHENDRARDVVDLLLLRDLTNAAGSPTEAEIKTAIIDTFTARARDAAALNYLQRHWPARLQAYPHWGASYAHAAASAGVKLDLADAVGEVNTWLDRIDGAITE